MPVHFTPDEMSMRRQNASLALQRAELDALLIFKQESMYYLTGYDSFGFSMFQCLIFDADGGTTLLTRLPDLRQAQYTSDIKNIKLWHDVEGIDPTETLLGILRQLNLSGKRLGVEFDSYGLKASYGRALEKALADSVLEDASKLIDALRAIKSPQEIAYCRMAAKLSDDAWDEAQKLAVAGAYEGDILAAMQGAVFKGGGDYAGNEFIIGSGPSALLVRYHAGKRHLDKDDQLTLEFSGAYMHYHAAMMRTLLVGKANPEHVSMHQICRDALEACMSAVKPGESMGTVYSEHSKVMDNAGYHEHRMRACGYGMGAVYNPLWVDPPMFYEGNPLEMKVGHVYFLHMILANSDRNLAMTLGQSVLVTDTGCENLSRSPLDLVINR